MTKGPVRWDLGAVDEAATDEGEERVRPPARTVRDVGRVELSRGFYIAVSIVQRAQVDGSHGAPCVRIALHTPDGRAYRWVDLWASRLRAVRELLRDADESGQAAAGPRGSAVRLGPRPRFTGGE